VIFPGKPEGETDESLWITARTPEEAQAKAEKEFEGQTFTLKRDEDVLDTWFSVSAF
jgi:valyl-tRNA synthetase